MTYKLDFFFVFAKIGALLGGLAVSLELTALAIVIGLVFGFVVAMMRLSRSRLLSVPAAAYIEFFRCTPALVQIVWFYYCIPIIVGLALDPFSSVLLALGLNIAAFNAEAYRAAIQAIPSAHLDAATALGLSSLKRARYIILPQAVRLAAPVLVTNGIGIFQQSSLVSLVAIGDLMYRGRMLAVETYRPIETLTLIALIYLLVTFIASLSVRLLERRLAADTG